MAPVLACEADKEIVCGRSPKQWGGLIGPHGRAGDKRVEQEMGAVHTCEVRDIAHQPDEQEAHRQGISALGLVVGDKLRKLWNNVRTTGDGSQIQEDGIPISRSMRPEKCSQKFRRVPVLSRTSQSRPNPWQRQRKPWSLVSRSYSASIFVR